MGISAVLRAGSATACIDVGEFSMQFTVREPERQFPATRLVGLKPGTKYWVFVDPARGPYAVDDGELATPSNHGYLGTITTPDGEG